MLDEMNEKLEQTKKERLFLKDNVIDQTTKRIAYVLGPNATEENIQYCAEPYLALVERFNELVDQSRDEIHGLNKELERQNMEIALLSKENEKYL